jgi:hypothetical protein
VKPLVVFAALWTKTGVRRTKPEPVTGTITICRNYIADDTTFCWEQVRFCAASSPNPHPPILAAAPAMRKNIEELVKDFRSANYN